ncbi:MAG: hypothetical protein C0478_12190 [Planctomyces sp.]|nr:hypothetical protein [Planctomyces sp.]
MEFNRRLFLGAMAVGLGASRFSSSKLWAKETAAAQPAVAGPKVVAAAGKFLQSLSDEQRGLVQFSFDAPERLNWHFIPKPRKGIKLRALTGPARKSAFALMKSGLTETGYDQAVKIMSLEEVLFLYEAGDREKRRERRDPEQYYFSVFGTPGMGLWGWRVEGHHLSLNYTLDGEKIIASTPEFYGCNPATMESAPGRILRVLGNEEDFARSAVTKASEATRAKLIVSSEAPKDVAGPGAPQPVVEAPAGLTLPDLGTESATQVRALIGEYLANMPEEVAQARLAEIERGGWENVHFAWWGGLDRYQPHHYRVQGPTFVIEYNNTQDGANHIHSMWRDVRGDFGKSIG